MARRFITNDYKITEQSIEIYGDEVDHVLAMRHNIGETIEINENICKIISIEKNKIICEIIGQASESGVPKTKITLYQALLKADKMEYVIQKSVELGISKIVPFESKNIVVKLDDKDKIKKHDRWSKIVVEAVKQCGRTDIPELKQTLNFNNFVKSLENYETIILAYENEEKSLKQVIKNINDDGEIAIVIGAEGGFELLEVQKILENKNAVSVSLGGRILRAETASLNLISILMYELEV